mgnify:CR=1 FL=1
MDRAIVVRTKRNVLQTKKIDGVTDRFDDSLRAAMEQETLLLFGEIVRNARGEPALETGPIEADQNWMFCEAGPVKIRLAAKAVPDLDPGPLAREYNP